MNEENQTVQFNRFDVVFLLLVLCMGIFEGYIWMRNYHCVREKGLFLGYALAITVFGFSFARIIMMLLCVNCIALIVQFIIDNHYLYTLGFIFLGFLKIFSLHLSQIFAPALLILGLSRFTKLKSRSKLLQFGARLFFLFAVYSLYYLVISSKIPHLNIGTCKQHTKASFDFK